MQELIGMLKNKYPAALKTSFFRSQMVKWQKLYNDLQRFRNRRPALYEKAMIGLVDWIGTRAQVEVNSLRELREAIKNQPFEGDGYE